MSDNKSLHQRMKKISKFITKVKEKAHNVFHEEEGVEKATTMTRRHSSYIRPPTEEQSNINLFDTRLKQEDHFNTIPPHKQTNIDNITSTRDTSLSPPPRHLKKDRQKSLNSINYQNRYSSPQIASKPCLSRSNTLGHHPTIIKYNPPDLSLIAPTHVVNTGLFTSSNSSTSLSSLSGRCDLITTRGLN
ncbi:unnamed protein product [Mucor hiemalis]